MAFPLLDELESSVDSDVVPEASHVVLPVILDGAARFGAAMRHPKRRVDEYPTPRALALSFASVTLESAKTPTSTIAPAAFFT